MNSWQRSLILLELRKLLTYRVNFWLEFLGSTLGHFGIAYCVWRAVFEESGRTEVGGYSFAMMLLYQLLVAIVGRATYAVDFSSISDEIYTGSLNRYLIYPIRFFEYKFFQQMTTNFFVMLQLSVLLAVYHMAVGFPAEMSLSLSRLLLFVVVLFGGMTLSFLMSWTIQMIAFWADQVWSLMVSFRFMVHLLGGTLIPLTLYSDSVSAALRLSPFYLLVAFPVEIFIGKNSATLTPFLCAMMIFWICVMAFVARLVWLRGLKNYTGVGI